MYIVLAMKHIHLTNEQCLFLNNLWCRQVERLRLTKKTIHNAM